MHVSSVLLDPYWMELDSYCQVDIRNRSIQLSGWRVQQDRTGTTLPWPFGVETTDAMELVDQVAPNEKSIFPVVIWSDASDSQRIVRRRKERWIRRGYTAIDSFATDRPAASFSVVVLVPSESTTVQGLD